MSTVAPLENKPANPSSPRASIGSRRLVQRQCACGSPTSALSEECPECKHKKLVQTKLMIGASNDPLEQEADRVANLVTNSPGGLQLSAAPLQIQRLSNSANAHAEYVPLSISNVLSKPGKPIDNGIRRNMENRFGHDFSRVRVHDDPAAACSARDVDARAYTFGNNIVFSSGAYSPETQSGKHLLAHELTHVIQQSSADRLAPWQEGRSYFSTSSQEASGQSPFAHLVAEFGQTAGTVQRQSIGDAAETLATSALELISPETRQFISDLVASVRESPSHVGEFITGELWESIQAHWPEIVGVTVVLLGSQAIIAALGAAPTGVSQVIAAILEIIVLAILFTFAAVETAGALREGLAWWSAARDAHGDPTRISEASRSFVRMLWHILMAVMALVGVRGRLSTGATARISAPLEPAPPPAPPLSPPSLTVIRGGNPGRVPMVDGRVVSTPRATTSSVRGGPVASARAGAAPELVPETAPEIEPPVELPPLRAVPDIPATSPSSGPASTLGSGVAGATGVAGGIATAPRPAPASRRRGRCPEPDGLTEACPLPFIWYKPPALYAPIIDMPNALPPTTLSVVQDPTPVCYTFIRGTICEDIGVTDWPSTGRVFQFMPYESRVAPQQAHFNDIMDRVGFDRTGFDAEHVWDIYLLGLEYDRLDNLWPASNQEQQLAGVRHRNQIRAYETEFGNVAGRWFEIVDVIHPA